MRIEKIAKASDFLEIAKSFLLKDEVEYSLMLGLVMARSRAKNMVDDYIYHIAYEDNQLIGASVVTGVNLLVTKLKSSVVSLLAQEIFKVQSALPGIVGDVDTCHLFAKEWEGMTGQSSKIGLQQKIYQLDRVIPQTRAAQGQLVQANQSHIKIVAQWFHDFMIESLPHEAVSMDKAIEIASRRVELGDVYLWIDQSGKVVASNMVGRPTDHSISVGFVYTPQDLRGRGYASTVVSNTSQLMLDKGYKKCALYTDATNPTSNGIYQKIGYYEIAKSVQILFNTKKDLP